MTSVFDFKSIETHYPEAPSLLSFEARDGTSLRYRFYDSPCKDAVCILLHGSSAHGEYLHPLAAYLSSQGAGQVYVPNIRGHYMSGSSRGDCAYIGQLEDDLVDLIQRMQLQNKKIFLFGHSSGGGLAIRFAGGEHGIPIHGYVLLSPAIPRAPTMRQGTAGGWANVKLLKLLFCLFLNTLGISRFNHLKVISFNKPKEACDGTETLAYSFRLNTSYHPRYPCGTDMQALGKKVLVLIGAEDEANDPAKYPEIMQTSGQALQVLEGIKHLNIVCDPRAMQAALNWVNFTRKSIYADRGL
jgi:alpha-beta hydrolase superfamily lysophospholipase